MSICQTWGCRVRAPAVPLFCGHTGSSAGRHSGVSGSDPVPERGDLIRYELMRARFRMDKPRRIWLYCSCRRSRVDSPPYTGIVSRAVCQISAGMVPGPSSIPAKGTRTRPLKQSDSLLTPVYEARANHSILPPNRIKRRRGLSCSRESPAVSVFDSCFLGVHRDHHQHKPGPHSLVWERQSPDIRCS